MFLYFFESGEYLDKNEITLSNSKQFTQKQLEELFTSYKKDCKFFGIWEFAKFLIDNHGFYYPSYEAGIIFENYVNPE